MHGLTTVHPPGQGQEETLLSRPLRVLTFNLQVGISTRAYYQYLTNSWQHVLPNAKRAERLDMIGGFLRHYDLVGLQEVDGGSFRSGNVNQVEYLGEKAKVPFAYQQLNRNLGRLAQHSNGLLSRLRPVRVESHRLPGPPGRGVIHAQFGSGPDALHVFVAHLSLGIRTQMRQLDYLYELMASSRHVMLMGDLNCTRTQLAQHSSLRNAIDLAPSEAQLTYPAWQPKRELDHILLSPSITVEKTCVLPPMFSDHLPIAADIRLPTACLRSLRQASREASDQ